MKAEITVSPTIYLAARDLLRLHDRHIDEARIHLDVRLPPGRWHEGPPIEGPAERGAHHPGFVPTDGS